jgi:hypothetical protein
VTTDPPASGPPADDEHEPQSYRPALVALSADVRGLVEDMADGLSGERAVLEWFQQITVRTLGQVQDDVYEGLADNLRGDMGPFLASLMTADARRETMDDLSDEHAQKVRERLLAERIVPAHREAFRHLRTDATEYVEEAGGGDMHNPHRQSAIAMRPALTEIDEWQERTLAKLLDGFEERSEILDWSHDVLLASHGEVPDGWVESVYREDSTAAMLTGESGPEKRGRRLFAAHYLLPMFRDGVRVLSGRAGEVADGEQIENDNTAPEWT